MCFTYGQWLHINTTSSAGAPLKSASETFLPLVSGRLKSGAGVPSSSMVEETAVMRLTSLIVNWQRRFY